MSLDYQNPKNFNKKIINVRKEKDAILRRATAQTVAKFLVEDEVSEIPPGILDGFWKYFNIIFLKRLAVLQGHFSSQADAGKREAKDLWKYIIKGFSDKPAKKKRRSRKKKSK